MSDWVTVCEAGEIPDPGKALFEVDDRMVVVVHVNGQYHCIDDVCTHDGGPLADGELHGTSIACPRHGAQFDVCTGKALTMPATEDTVAHEIKVENNQVMVRVRSSD